MNFFTLMDRLEGLYDTYAGQRLSASQITHAISWAIPYREVDFYTVKTINSAPQAITVSGLYDPEDDEMGTRPIELELSYFKKKRTYYFHSSSMSFRKWRRLCYDVVSVLGHEYVHLNQHRSRDFKGGRGFRSRHTDEKIRELQEYLGHSDEIDAYSFSAAAEMAMSLRLGQDPDFLKTSIYKEYSEAFGPDHSVVAKLQQRSLKYYNILKEQYNGQKHKRTIRSRRLLGTDR